MTADEILAASIKAITDKINPGEQDYSRVVPFSFDEKLARQAATAEYEPYYKQTLTDYTQTIERNKSRSAEDLQKTIDFLGGSKEYYTGAARRILDQAIRQTKEGYQGRGLYLSGASNRDIKELQTENDSKLAEYNRQQTNDIAKAQLENKRLGEDLSTSLSQTTRDLGQEQKYAVESGVLKRRGEYQTAYEMGRQKYYSGLGYIV